MEQFESYWRHRERGGFRLRSNAGAIPGMILVLIGALFFLNNLHIFRMRELFRYWPAILIAFGIVKLVDSKYSSGRVFGGVVAGIGAVFLARTLGFLTIGMREIWPLFLVGLGLLLLAQRTGEWYVKFPDPMSARPVGASSVKIDSIFSGARRVVTTQDFQGGEVMVIFGGAELDLRQAGMIADSATIEINALFGGVEIKVPRNWSAVVQGVGIFGGFADNTVQPDPAQWPVVKQLFVRGTAALGGVDVKN
jgi:predicted membrane protein